MRLTHTLTVYDVEGLLFLLLTFSLLLLHQKSDSAPPTRPSHCTIYVAKSYPAWQHSALSLLANHYKVMLAPVELF